MAKTIFDTAGDGYTNGQVQTDGAYNMPTLESELAHPVQTDGFVDFKDPVAGLNGIVVGLAEDDASAATDQIAVRFRGMVRVSVTATNGTGNVAVAKGDELFISDGADGGTIGVVSRDPRGRLFGFSQGTATSGATATILVQLVASTSKASPIFTVHHNFAAADITANQIVYQAIRNVRLLGVIERHTTAAGGAGTLQIQKVDDGAAVTAGSDSLAAAIDIDGTADTAQYAAALSAGTELLTPGEAFVLDLASGAVGSLAAASITLILAEV